jgi:hypothetical protein
MFLSDERELFGSRKYLGRAAVLQDNFIEVEKRDLLSVDLQLAGFGFHASKSSEGLMGPHDAFNGRQRPDIEYYSDCQPR